MAIIMYMVGCFSLMIYNAVVIYRKNSSNKALAYNTDKWINDIYEQFTNNSNMLIISHKHEKHLLECLKHVEELIAFSNALNHFKSKRSKIYEKYMDMLVKKKVFHRLADIYKEKRNEERAYFAYFVSQHPPVIQNAKGLCTSFISTIVSYVESSDIYCRVNVLKALCNIGDMHGVLNILQFFSDKYNYIHPKLLAEDLLNFAGDKEVLAFYLWGKHKIWNDNIVLGVITFITTFSDEFRSAFLPVLQNKSASAEIRLAIIRYYSQYFYEPAQSILVEYLNQTDNYDFAIDAASALSKYPGLITTKALKSALQSDDWYVQYNAAYSLVELGEHSEGFLNDLQSSNAMQIIEYMLEQANDENDMNVREVII